MKQRILSTLLALAMCLSLLPTAAFADGENDGSAETHTHCVCGAEHMAIGNHTTESTATFTAWEEDDALPTDAGSYYLTCDVELHGTWTVSSDVTLCLNGHSMTAKANSVAIQINSGGTLTVTDCANTPGKITRASGATGRGVDNAGTFNLYAGTICGYSDNSTYGSYGSAVYSHGCFNMYGGTVSDCTGYYPLTMDLGDKGTIYGGNIHVETFTTGTIAGGTFTLGAGQQVEISRYEATGSNQSNDSWGIVTDGTFNGKVLNEGTIKGGTFNGTVTNNYDVNDGTFSGTVINNAYGYINGGTFNGTVTNQKNGEIYGGTFSGTVTNEKNGVIHDSAYKTVTFHTASTTTQKILCGQKVTQPANSDVSTWYTGVGLKVYSFDTPVTQNMDLYSLQALQAICPHANITDDGYCPDCTTQMAAKVGSNYYTTLVEALEKANNGTVVLLKNVGGGHTFENGGPATLDLNGHTLVSLSLEEVNLTLKDSSTAKSGAITSQILMHNLSTLTVESGKVKFLSISSQSATVTLKGGTFETLTRIVGLENHTPQSILAPGYAYKDETGAFLTVANLTFPVTNVSAAPCTHSAPGADGKCSYCGQTFAAQVSENYYISFEEAYAAAQNSSTVTLLSDTGFAATSDDTTRTISKNITLDLNGHIFLSKIGSEEKRTIITSTVKIKGAGTFNYLEIQGGTVTVDDANTTIDYVALVSGTLNLKHGKVSDVEVSEDKTQESTFNMSGGSVEAIHVYPKGTVNLSGGDVLYNIYGTKVFGAAPQAIPDMLADGYAYQSLDVDQTYDSIHGCWNFTVTGVGDLVKQSEIDHALYHVRIVKCTDHDYSNDDGTCVYCLSAKPTNSGGSSGSSSGGSTTNSPVKNPDGSTTTTTTDKNGNVTEITKDTNGVTGTTVTDKDGNVTSVSANIPASATKDGETVPLPIDKVDPKNETEIKVDVPKGGATIEIPVENPTPGTVVVIVGKDGTETVIPGSKVTENGVEVTLTEDATIKVIDNAKSFSDVPANAYFADAVAWASARNITGGITATTFGPHASCTRAQLVTFLWRAAGQPEAAAESSFTDVSADAYYADAVAWAVENGITNGYADGTFGVNTPCTRAHAVAFLFRYAASQGMDFVTLQELVSGYTDAGQVPDYALSAFNWALAGGIVQGNAGSLMPNSPCTRAQIVTFLYRLLGK